MAKRLRLDQLRLDGDTQPRVELDRDVIKEYQEAYVSNATMPPLTVFYDGADYWLADGFHRWHAARKASVDKVSCDLKRGTLEDARWFSYAANQTHGIRRSNLDKQKAVKAALLHPNGAKLSDSAIAEHIGVSHTMVGKYRAELEATCKVCKSDDRIGRDGRTTNTSKVGRAAKNTEPKDELDDLDLGESEEPEDPENEWKGDEAEDDPAEDESGEATFATDMEVAMQETWDTWPDTPAPVVCAVLENLAAKVRENSCG